ncbi:phosphate ABC transporter permease PstA [Labrys wisconsinensis]|uniref:Phosphate transport system permease protein PstA n=1 Tax=Labrys wisconsinensis TaxID=425677 RepID=A0ABU0JE21_9HYPH|nr:phosphate ABC transporter permease PstA [Labrys wisconsinensis]MDQ0472519.1 phosphate transport system permease protein [Labrys wisconsinensis]
MDRLARRRAVDYAMKAISTGFALISLFMLAWILFTLIERGGPALGLGVFTNVMSPPGGGGGLLNAIVGSLIQIVVALVIGTPIGVMAGTFLAEAGRGSRLADLIRFVNDILLSAPSILIGLFVYQMVVVPTGGFSGWAGTLALAIILMPVVVRTTEDMLALVPTTLREAAFALGAPQWKVIMLVTWRAAQTGIVTGILLALARAAGETAPLLFTSLGNNDWSTDLSRPMASLPVAIYQYAGSPFDDWVALAWAGALLITVGVLALNIVTRLLLAPKR